MEVVFVCWLLDVIQTDIVVERHAEFSVRYVRGKYSNEACTCKYITSSYFRGPILKSSIPGSIPGGRYPSSTPLLRVSCAKCTITSESFDGDQAIDRYAELKNAE